MLSQRPATQQNTRRNAQSYFKNSKTSIESDYLMLSPSLPLEFDIALAVQATVNPYRKDYWLR